MPRLRCFLAFFCTFFPPSSEHVGEGALPLSVSLLTSFPVSFPALLPSRFLALLNCFFSGQEKECYFSLRCFLCPSRHNRSQRATSRRAVDALLSSTAFTMRVATTCPSTTTIAHAAGINLVRSALRLQRTGKRLCSTKRAELVLVEGS